MMISRKRNPWNLEVPYAMNWSSNDDGNKDDDASSSVGGGCGFASPDRTRKQQESLRPGDVIAYLFRLYRG
jgi:hypothetical protein